MQIGQNSHFASLGHSLLEISQFEQQKSVNQ